MKTHFWLMLRTLCSYALFAAALLLATDLAHDFGGLAPLMRHTVVELPLMLFLYFALRQLLQGRRGRGLIAALPLLTMYLMFDGYFIVFKRVLRLTEISEVPELLGVMPLSMSIPLIAILAIPFLWILLKLRVQSHLKLLLAIAPLGLLITLILFSPAAYLAGFHTVSNGIVEWSDERSVERSGRVSMVLYHEAKRRAALKEAKAYLGNPLYEEDFQADVDVLNAHLTPRNVHILVLESFIDPTLFDQVKVEPDPLVPAFRKLLVNGTGNFSISPTWGGYTAQAEFEILCGVPALQKLSTIEFNLFSGSKVHCLPDLLNALDYQTASSRGFKPYFFNSLAAMRGMGFKDTYYASEYAPNRQTYLKTGNVEKEQYMFDRDMLVQNRSFIDERLSNSAAPLLNYVLTIYGHFPFVLDEQVRPPVLAFSGKEALDAEQQVLFNQIYYRTQAIAEHVDALIKSDPEALIVMISDHLPPLQERRGGYSRLGYLSGDEQADYKTLLNVIDRGVPIDVGTLYQYQLKNVLLDRLTQGQYCRLRPCEPRSEERLSQDYLRFMAHAVNTAP